MYLAITAKTFLAGQRNKIFREHIQIDAVTQQLPGTRISISCWSTLQTEFPVKTSRETIYHDANFRWSMLNILLVEYKYLYIKKYAAERSRKYMCGPVAP